MYDVSRWKKLRQEWTGGLGLLERNVGPRVWNWFLWLIKGRLWVLERVGEARFSCWSFEKKEIGGVCRRRFFFSLFIILWEILKIFFWKWTKID